MTVKEKAAYLLGLLDGMKIDKNSDEGKIYHAVADAIKVVADEIEEIQENVDDLYELTEELDENLNNIEDLLVENDDDDYDDECDCEYQITCPDCGEEIFVDAEILENEIITCPVCGTQVEFDPNADEIEFE